MADTQNPAQVLRAAAAQLEGLKRWEIVDLDEWLTHIGEQTPVAAAYLTVLARIPGPLANLLQEVSLRWDLMGNPLGDYDEAQDWVDVANAILATTPVGGAA